MSMTDFEQWLDSPRGKYLLAWEERKLDLIVSDIFGFNALQLGLPGHDFLRQNRMPQRLVGGEHAGGDLRCSLAELPFATQSLDLVVLPHVLEFVDQPHALLREVERVLLPEGSVVISGFNPLSMWGLRRALSGNLGVAPWVGQYLSVPRLKDWLTLLSFETCGGAFGAYAPPVSSEKWLRRWSFMDAAGARWWPFAGGIYVIHAIKRTKGMRLITPQWRNRVSRKKNMLPVAQRHEDDGAAGPLNKS